MARFAELTDAELMQLLDDKVSDSLKNTVRYPGLSNYAISREGTFRDVEQLPPNHWIRTYSVSISIRGITKQIVTVIIDQ